MSWAGIAVATVPCIGTQTGVSAFLTLPLPLERESFVQGQLVPSRCPTHIQTTILLRPGPSMLNIGPALCTLRGMCCRMLTQPSTGLRRPSPRRARRGRGTPPIQGCAPPNSPLLSTLALALLGCPEGSSPGQENDARPEERGSSYPSLINPSKRWNLRGTHQNTGGKGF